MKKTKIFILIFIFALIANVSLVIPYTQNETAKRDPDFSNKMKTKNDGDSLIPIKDHSMTLKTWLQDLKLGNKIETTVDEPLSQKTAITSQTYNVGDTEEFWTQDDYKAWNNIDEDGDGLYGFYDYDWDEAMYEVTAECKIVTKNAYIFVDQAEGSSYDSYLQEMSDEYEDNIHTMLKTYFGEMPDIDSNNRLIILIFDIRDENYYGQSSTFIAGYFWALHQYSTVSNPSNIQYYSEEKEIIHIDVRTFSQDIAAPTVAHEGQHLIHFANDDSETIWLDEGASTFAEYLCGYEEGLDLYIQSSSKQGYFDNSASSLTYWQQTLRNYGQAFLFMTFISQHYGGADTVREIVQSYYHGMDSIMRVLDNLGYELSEKDLFMEWSIANIVNNATLGNNYHYPDSSLFNNRRISYKMEYNSFPITGFANVEYWGAQYVKLPDIKGTGEVIITTESSSEFGAVTVAFKKDGIELDEIMLNDGQGRVMYKYDATTTEIALILISFEGTTSGENTADPVPTTSFTYSATIAEFIGISGNISYSSDGKYVRVKNIQIYNVDGTIMDNTDFDTAKYYIVDTISSQIMLDGSLEWYPDNKTWNTNYIDVSELKQGFYRFEYNFSSDTSDFNFRSYKVSIGKYYLDFGQTIYNINEQYISISGIKAGINPDTLWEENEVESAQYFLMEYVGIGEFVERKVGDLVWNNSSWNTPKISTLGLNNGTYVFVFHFTVNGEEIILNSEAIVLDQNRPAKSTIPGFNLIILIFALFSYIFIKKKRKKN